MNTMFGDMNNPLTYVVILIAGFFIRHFWRQRELKKSIKKDQDKIYGWLMQEFREREDFEFRTTKAISSATHLSEDRIREVAITDHRIHKSTGQKDDRWSVKAKPLI